MKNLHLHQERTWNIKSEVTLSGIKQEPPHPHKIVLLLHGLEERGKRIYRKISPYIPDGIKILSPNGPYPIRKQNSSRLGYAWYFYDSQQRQYVHPFQDSCLWLKDLVHDENPNKLPVTIIGFSQGGYLAPHVASLIEEVDMVIGLSCEFRSNHILDLLESTESTESTGFKVTQEPKRKYKHLLKLPFINIHGDEDLIISLDDAKLHSAKLRDAGFKTQFISVSQTGHEINQEIGQLIQQVLKNQR